MLLQIHCYTNREREDVRFVTHCVLLLMLMYVYSNILLLAVGVPMMFAIHPVSPNKIL